mgnify:CR=1 FL=1
MNPQNNKNFSEMYQQKHFSILQVTYWDTKEIIRKNYESLQKILQENESKPSNERKDYKITQESLKQSYIILTAQKERENYLSFLKYYYFLSQPISLKQLKKNYYNKIFPYYMFTIKIKEKTQICDLVIDFITKKMSISHKDKIIQSVISDDIITVNKKFGTSIILMTKNNSSNDKNKQKSEFKEIEFEPEISQQIDIIYTIISYFAKSIEDNNFYSLLLNDTYRPCGIILRSKILKGHSSKFLKKDDRYAVLGSSMIIIFKNEDMKDVRNVLPLYPFLMRINFFEKEKTIVLIYPTREQSLSFYDEEHYTMWTTTLKEIFISRIKSKMETVELLEVNKMKEKGKIIKEIGVEIECIQEEIKIVKDKIDNFTKKIQGDKEKNEL